MKATAVSGSGVSVLYPLLLGAVEGGIAGLVEAAVMIRRGSNLVSLGDLFPVAFFHLVLWGVVGLALGLVVKALVLVRRRRPRPEDEKAFYIASVSFLVVLVTVGAHMNVFILPEMLSRISILFDGVLLLACLALGFTLFRLARRRIAGRGLRRGSPLVVAGIVLMVALVVAAAARPGSRRGEEAQGVPKVGGLNVILIVPDALRPDHLGCYGYERRTSPTVDRLAAEGQLFLEAYAHAPLTKQSTATMVTSLYPSTHNVLYLEDALPESATLLMEEASKGNLRTAVFSANALISPFFGFGRGVDFFYFERIPVMRRTVLGQASMAIGFRVPRLLCVRRFLEAVEILVPRTGAGSAYEGTDCASLNSAFLEWIDEAPDASFFAYLHYMETHAPFVPPPPFETRFDPDYDGRRLTEFPASVRDMLPFFEGPPLSERELTNLVAQYDGSIAYFDEELGRLLRELESRGLAANTLVAITSDHGEEFYDHRGWGHGHSLYEELLRVPLVLWCPRHLEGGKRIRAAVRHVDLAPTLMGAAGLGDAIGTAGFVGRNLWPALVASEEPPSGAPIYAECFSGEAHARAIRLGHNKLVHTTSRGRESVQMFDLSNDPGETEDLSTEMPELRSALMSELVSINVDALAGRMETRRTEMDEGTKEALRTLGYLD